MCAKCVGHSWGGSAKALHIYTEVKLLNHKLDQIRVQIKASIMDMFHGKNRIIYIYTSKNQEKRSNKCIKTWNLLIFPSDLFVHFICQKVGHPNSESWHPAWVQFAISELLDARHLHEGYSNHVEIPGPQGRRAAWLSSDCFAVILNMAMNLCDL